MSAREVRAGNMNSVHMTYSVVFSVAILTLKQKNAHHSVLEKTVIFISLLVRNNGNFHHPQTKKMPHQMRG